MRFMLQSRGWKTLMPLPARSLVFPRRHASNKTSDPLRILFCGSEDFSIASLQAIHDEHRVNRDFIASIDVVCRPAKRVGRNLSQIREGDLAYNVHLYHDAESLQVPIAAVARQLSLPLHQIDTFTGWNVSPIMTDLVS